MFKKILAGTDGFGPASAALERAVELAENTGAELLVCSAYPERSKHDVFVPGEGPAGIDVATGLLRAAEERYGARVRMRTIALPGAPEHVLVSIAAEEEADLIIIGNKGMRDRLHPGTVPNHVSHRAPCHVLIVNTTE